MTKQYNIKISLTIALTLSTIMSLSNGLKADCSQLNLVYDQYATATTLMSIDYQKCGDPKGKKTNYKHQPWAPGLVPGGIETGSHVCIGDANYHYCAEGGEFDMPPGNHTIKCGPTGETAKTPGGGKWMSCKLD